MRAIIRRRKSLIFATIAMLLFIFMCISTHTQNERYIAAIRQNHSDTSITTLTQSQNLIPFIIWTYWSSDTLPPFIQLCINNWKFYNPHHKIIVLTPTTLPSYTSLPLMFSKMTLPAQSDWTRLRILSLHGGIWMDASTLLTTSLSHIHAHTTPVMYYFKYWTTQKVYPVYESWFIATPQNAPLIVAWYEEFNVCFTQHEMHNTYLDALGREFEFGELVQNMKMLAYVKIHVALQVVLRRAKGMYDVFGRVAEYDSGPTSLQQGLGWDAHAYAEMFIKKWKGGALPEIIKLRSNERNAILQILDKGVKVDDESIYSLFLQRKQ